MLFIYRCRLWKVGNPFQKETNIMLKVSSLYNKSRQTLLLLYVSLDDT